MKQKIYSLLEKESTTKLEKLLANQTYLDLKNAKINNEHIKILTAILERNTTITTIDFSDNNIGNPGARALLKLLENNKSIESIDLKYNSAIRVEMLIAINKALKEKTTSSHSHIRKEQQHLEKIVEERLKLTQENSELTDRLQSTEQQASMAKDSLENQLKASQQQLAEETSKLTQQNSELADKLQLTEQQASMAKESLENQLRILQQFNHATIIEHDAVVVTGNQDESSSCTIL